MGKSGYKADLMSAPCAYAPKLQKAVDMIVEAPREMKALVLVSKRGGYSSMLALLQSAGLGPIATMDEHDEFNDVAANLRGERYRVLVKE